MFHLLVPQCAGATPEGDSLHQEGNRLFYSSFTLKGHTFKIRDGVYLPPDTYTFPAKQDKPVSQRKSGASSDRKNPDKYPELYRKSEYVKGSNLDVPTPFQIGKLNVLLHQFHHSNAFIAKININFIQ